MPLTLSRHAGPHREGHPTIRYKLGSYQDGGISVAHAAPTRAPYVQPFDTADLGGNVVNGEGSDRPRPASRAPSDMRPEDSPIGARVANLGSMRAMEIAQRVEAAGRAGESSAQQENGPLLDPCAPPTHTLSLLVSSTPLLYLPNPRLDPLQLLSPPRPCPTFPSSD